MANTETDLAVALAEAVATAGITAIVKLIRNGIATTADASVPYDVRMQVHGILFPDGGGLLETEKEAELDKKALDGIP